MVSGVETLGPQETGTHQPGWDSRGQRTRQFLTLAAFTKAIGHIISPPTNQLAEKEINELTYSLQ